MYIHTPPHRGRCRAPPSPAQLHGHGRAVSCWRALVRMTAKGVGVMGGHRTRYGLQT